MPRPNMLTVRDVSERLKCSAWYVYELCASRRLVHVHLGKDPDRGPVRISEAALEAWIEERERPSGELAHGNTRAAR